jgi:ATP-dependent protease Clp ATPase subunit
MEPKNESLTNKKLTEVETNEAKKPTKKDPKEKKSTEKTKEQDPKEMVSEQPQQFLIQLMSGDIDPNMMMDEDAYTAEQIEDLKLSIKEWLGRVPFTEFRNAIHKDVIGQDNLDLILANVYNYLTNVALGNPVNNNMLMAAPSGCGKTETYRSLRNYFKTEIPELTISQVDVSVITEEGIVGAGSSILVDELMENGTNGYGIVFMDEFDKKLIPSFAEGANTSAAVQNQLLTIIEGREVPFILNGQPTGYYIDTSNTMFIGLGSFNESREQKKNAAKNNLGFGARAQDNDMFDEITREDMIKMGASYEMIGRFPLIVNYHKLSEEAVDKIIDKTLETLRLAYQLPIELDADMRTQLHEFANGVYGCRMLDSSIRDQVIKQYTAWLIGGCKKKKIVIHSVTESELV